MKYPSIVRDIIDFMNDTEVCNIGYYDGVIDNERPYRVEVWASQGVTSATIFMSLEDLKVENVKKILINEHILEIIEDKIFITEIEDVENNKFYSINVPLEGNNHTINKLLIETKPFY